jgi:hypothetical protein
VGRWVWVSKIAWILTGGWEGHQPGRAAAIISEMLTPHGFDVTVCTSLDVLQDESALREVDLIVPNWTQGQIARPLLTNWLTAVREGGTGVAGMHGGMGDAFRTEPPYQEMVGGQWVSHPGGEGATYSIQISDPTHPLTEGVPEFTVTTEQYYMHVDPVISVHATTRFGDVVMPVVWTKHFGRGRIFYCSIGHRPELLLRPELATMMTRGLLWAARGS